jgi:hypothetical protein
VVAAVAVVTAEALVDAEAEASVVVVVAVAVVLLAVVLAEEAEALPPVPTPPTGVDLAISLARRPLLNKYVSCRMETGRLCHVVFQRRPIPVELLYNGLVYQWSCLPSGPGNFPKSL